MRGLNDTWLGWIVLTLVIAEVFILIAVIIHNVAKALQ